MMRLFPLCLVAACGTSAPATPAVPTSSALPVASAPASVVAASSAAASTPPARPGQTWSRKDAKPGTLLASDTPAPSQADWKRAKSATIWGLSKLGCSAKLAGGWLKISCPFGLNNPEEPTISPSGNGDWRASWSADSLELSLPIASGLSTHMLVDAGESGLILNLEWRYKLSQPPVLGFVNSATNPDCDGKLEAAGEKPYSWTEDCKRNNSGCEALLQCLYDDPQNRRACPPGYEFTGACIVRCDADADCATGWTCSDRTDEPGFCLEPE